MHDAFATRWISDIPQLRKWLWAYVALWLPGLSLTIWGMVLSPPSDLLTTIGGGTLVVSLAPYVMSIVYSYKIQGALHSAKLYPHGTVHVFMGALLLNPFVMGVAIPASVLRVAKRIRRAHPEFASAATS